MNNRLYIIVSKKLPTIGYKAAQAGHAVAQWVYDNKNQDTWNNEYLIMLEAKNLKTLKRKLVKLDVKFSEFKEPDLNNQITAIAVLHEGSLFKNLQLVGSEH